MTGSMSNVLRWLAVVALLTIPPELAAISALQNADTPLPDRWLAGMDRGDKEDAVSQLASLPVSFRRALLRSLDPTERSDAWRAVAERFRAARPNRTEEQNAVINRIIELSSPDTFARPSPSVVISVNETANRVEELFGAEAVRELFFAAGPVTAEEDLGALPMRVRFERYVRTHFVAQATVLDCNCLTISPGIDCPGGFLCSEATGCEFQWWGCGIWGLEYCNGYCVPVP